MYLLLEFGVLEKEKFYAAYLFFFLYTLLGSVFMLLSILYIYYQVGTTDYEVLLQLFHFHQLEQKLLWLYFFYSFCY